MAHVFHSGTNVFKNSNGRSSLPDHVRETPSVPVFKSRFQAFLVMPRAFNFR